MTILGVDMKGNDILDVRTDNYGLYFYEHGIAPPLFLCVEEDEALETFDEMVRRKQEEIFWSLK